MTLNNSVHSGKQVIIHAGFHKTATSSIQHTLAHNRTFLETNGFHYPNFVVEGKQFFNKSIPLSGYFMKHPETFKHYWYYNQLDHKKVNGLIQQFLEQDVNQCDKLIFSDEFISTLSKETLIKLKSDFEGRGFKIRIISYVREPYNFLVSSVQQRSQIDNIEKILRTINTRATVNKIRRIKEVFGCSAEFYSFEKTCHHDNGPVGFFFDLLQIKLDANNILISNEGMSNQASRLSSHINKITPLYISSTQINPNRRRFDTDQIYKIRGDKFGLTSKEVENILPKIKESRSEISDQLGREFLPVCEITSIPEHVIWNEEQLDDLINISESLDLHILSIVHKYFLDLGDNFGMDCPEKAAQFYTFARKRLHDENIKNNPTIIERFRYFVLIHILRRVNEWRGRI